MQEHIVAVFGSDEPARAAARELAAVGIPEKDIRRYDSDEISRTRGVDENRKGGFWAWLLGEEQPVTDGDYYAREDTFYNARVTAGQAVLAVTVEDDARIHRAVEIIEAHKPLNIEEETDEHATGHTGTVASRAVPATGVVSSGVAASTPETMGTGPETMKTAPGTRGTGPGTMGSVPETTGTMEANRRARGERVEGEQTIPLAEEELEVGKRMVDHGTTRVHRYVVERPVERDVTLRGERVTIEHRRPTETRAPGAGAFEERTVEVHESEEVPVVNKTARVNEEVVVKREDTERHEKVRDTVRHEEVEVTPDKRTREMRGKP
jgi:uncharacterized protein (TIGR02271 family)